MPGLAFQQPFRVCQGDQTPLAGSAPARTSVVGLAEVRKAPSDLAMQLVGG
jgi:hypothetical protein